MPFAGRFLAGVVALSLISIALSADSDPTIFSTDDSSLLAAETSNAGGFSDLFSESTSTPDLAALDISSGKDLNSADWDPQWLNPTDLDPSALEASCAGDGTQKIGKARRRRRDGTTCLQDPKKNSLDPANLKLPNLLQIGPGPGQGQEDLTVDFGLDDDDNDNCPPPYVKHVCCTGPGLQSFPDSGIWDAVQGCAPCT